MRLINAMTLEIKEFVSEIPPYAILSHRWGEEEVSYQDFNNASLRSQRAGFEKIRLTCTQALQDGIEYAWVDTCCIDKTSSAELGEAINSMFKWYQWSKMCYAYLDDVDGDTILAARTGVAPGTSVWHASIAGSRWFTRGWTLQELIAPKDVQFYSRSWVWIGSKLSLITELHEVTGVGEDILCGAPLNTVSVAERMRWAADRVTTREEDTAYSLMGIFEVNMPMLYGEGSKAFLRLQEEIIKEWDDHSLFAWTASTESERQAPLRGILAQTPREFAHSHNIVP
ncbi:HET-domain-containing protein, partial [Lepidopterella palustris CBS 459.81]